MKLAFGAQRSTRSSTKTMLVMGETPFIAPQLAIPPGTLLKVCSLSAYVAWASSLSTTLSQLSDINTCIIMLHICLSASFSHPFPHIPLFDFLFVFDSLSLHTHLLFWRFGYWKHRTRGMHSSQNFNQSPFFFLLSLFSIYERTWSTNHSSFRFTFLIVDHIVAGSTL